MRFLVFLSGLITIAFLFSGCPRKQNSIQNIKTFAKLYGYVRWFHPGDEASQIDWDKFAVYGTQKVENCKSAIELKNTLMELFTPIVRDLSIYESGSPQEVVSKYQSAEIISFDKFTSWQHKGVYLGEKSNIYNSIRTNKFSNKAVSVLNKYLTDPSKLNTRELRFTGYFKIKSGDTTSSASMYIRPVKKGIHFSTLHEYTAVKSQKITSADWQKYELSHVMNEEPAYVAYGILLENDISLFADNVTFSIKSNGEWEETDIEDPGFESGNISDEMENWKTFGSMHAMSQVQGEAYAGNYYMKTEYTGKIFDAEPGKGEFLNKSIGSELYCQLPISLPLVDGKTLSSSDSLVFKEFKRELDSLSIIDSEETHQYLGSLVIAWNVLQHFYPYFDVIDTNWDSVLDKTILELYSCRTKQEYYTAFCKMMADLEDGHGIVYGLRKEYHLKIRTEWIEDKIVVTASEDSLFKIGDIILSLDSIPAEMVLSELEKTISGSPQLRRHRALNILGSKFSPDSTLVSISRDGNIHSYTVANTSARKNLFFNRIRDFKYQDETIREIEPGIVYINQGNSTSETFNDWLDTLVNARCILFDNRWGGRLNFFEIIPHLIDTIVSSARWNIPQVIYPDHIGMEFDKSNWTMNPEMPHISSKIIIMNAPSVVSSGETTMGIIDHYDLAVTVGETTAGCNGNINWIELPCGFNIMFTGMKVLKHDGSQHHLIGFKPDYPVEKTIRAIQEGQDEILEKALEIARN